MTNMMKNSIMAVLGLLTFVLSAFIAYKVSNQSWLAARTNNR